MALGFGGLTEPVEDVATVTATGAIGGADLATGDTVDVHSIVDRLSFAELASETVADGTTQQTTDSGEIQVASPWVIGAGVALLIGAAYYLGDSGK